jgi:hypothetical protein
VFCGLGLFGIVQLGHGIRHLAFGHAHPLAIDAVVDAQQFLARFDVLEVLDQHLGHIAVDLGRQHGDRAAHVGVVGSDARAVEGTEMPGPHDQADADGGNDRHDADRGRRGLDLLRWRRLDRRACGRRRRAVVRIAGRRRIGFERLRFVRG